MSDKAVKIATLKAELEQVRAQRSSGITSVTTDGVSTSLDQNVLQQREQELLDELAAIDPVTRKERRKRIVSFDLGGFY